MSNYNEDGVMKMKRILCFLVMMVSIISINGMDINKEPDLVNSISFNRDYCLTVIAHLNEIENKEAFAKELIQMCRDNSFKTIKFSTDLGHATELRMTVYLTEADWKNGESAMNVSYTQKSLSREYDIVNNPEKFELVVK